MSWRLRRSQETLVIGCDWDISEYGVSANLKYGKKRHDSIAASLIIFCCLSLHRTPSIYPPILNSNKSFGMSPASLVKIGRVVSAAVLARTPKRFRGVTARNVWICKQRNCGDHVYVQALRGAWPFGTDHLRTLHRAPGSLGTKG